MILTLNPLRDWDLTKTRSSWQYTCIYLCFLRVCLLLMRSSEILLTFAWLARLLVINSSGIPLKTSFILCCISCLKNIHTRLRAAYMHIYKQTVYFQEYSSSVLLLFKINVFDSDNFFWRLLKIQNTKLIKRFQNREEISTNEDWINFCLLVSINSVITVSFSFSSEKTKEKNELSFNFALIELLSMMPSVQWTVFILPYMYLSKVLVSNVFQYGN